MYILYNYIYIYRASYKAENYILFIRITYLDYWSTYIATCTVYTYV